MQSFKSLALLKAELDQIRRSNKTIGLVPTMGNLHQGHLALVEKAKQDCDYVLATIFVNPMQFGPGEDFEHYPKTFEQDIEKLIDIDCDGLFFPSVEEMYPNGFKQQTIVSVPELAGIHCGKSRPIHFDGVCTVVSKLFHLTNPDQAFFGEKDFQQLLIIKKMVADLCMPIEIIGVPIFREKSGLAMSSRNNYLSSEQKEIAAQLSISLNLAKDEILHANNTVDFQAIKQTAKAAIESAGMTLDFFNVCNASTLQAASNSDRHMVILAAVYLGQSRLIDNIEFHRP